MECALRLFRSEGPWSTVRNAMHADFSWDRSVATYAELYRRRAQTT
jgi:glycogen synthase